MYVRRLLCLLLGLWLGATFLMVLAATRNFQVANRTAAAPPPPLAEYVKKAGAEPIRQILRYEASEQNRQLFDLWGVFQFGMALVVFLMVLFATSSGRIPVFLSLFIVILVGVMHWLINPQISAGSRVLDFVPLDQMMAERARLRSIHNIYSSMEVGKTILVAVLAGFFLFGGQRRSRGELR